jgi:hypothetical protein
MARGRRGRGEPSPEHVSHVLLFRTTHRTDLARVTEVKHRDQSSASTSAGLEKKKGGQKRRTKRDDLNTVPTTLGNADNMIVPNGTHIEIDPPQKRWPRLVRSTVYNPDYPTFCECLQPHCPHHCPTARGILSRGCTTYSWPAHETMSYSDWSLLAEPHANHDAGVEADRRGGLVGDPRSCKCVQFTTRIC